LEFRSIYGIHVAIRIIPKECVDAANSEYVDRAILQPLAREYPTEDAAVSEIARRSAELTLPKGTSTLSATSTAKIRSFAT